MKAKLPALLFAAAIGPAQACAVTEILSGDVELNILVHKDYETAIVRHANFNDEKLSFGSIKGEITVERGAFAVRTPNQEVVGTISPALVVEGVDGCEKQSPVIIRRNQRNSFTVLSRGTSIGTISGRFPRNSFGVK
jgi:hypothetical protein